MHVVRTCPHASNCVTVHLLFIGECRSLTAKSKGWTWEDGRLAAKPLFEALEAMGVDPRAHEYTNLWLDTSPPTIAANKFDWLGMKQSSGFVLGKRVSNEMNTRGVDHVALVHPAARGRIRKRERYHAHVKKTLTPVVSKILRIQSTHNEPAATWIERYFLKNRKGAYRELKGIPGNGQYAPGVDETLAWFRRLGVTHVEVAPGWSDTVTPKTYRLVAFARHIRRLEREAE